MLFNSIEFLLFFAVVTLGYYCLQHRYRWLWLLIASCYFYMAFRPIYILILAFTILIDYCAGIVIEGSSGTRKKVYLFVSIIANVGVLCIFKYYNFFASNVNQYTNEAWPLLNILLPVGLSFHTFQAMSYTFEVYRGNQKAERHLGLYALYVMFYPQLVAGPIERPQNILPQFRVKHTFSYQNVRDGLLLACWGLFKKVAIADRLAVFVDQVFNHPLDYGGPSIVVAAVFFAFQIYCDFSGYTDMAIGIAQVMGFTLMKNFDRPYAARRVGEFWRRWHISLSTWFRDYLYLPLGGNRKGLIRTLCNTGIVFLVSGLWHGANWNYLIWGALHGTYLMMGILTAGFLKKATEVLHLPELLLKVWGVISTFVLVTFAWIFFRADYADPSLLWHLIGNLREGWSEFFSQWSDLGYFMEKICLGQKRRNFVMALVMILFLELVQYFQHRKGSLRDLLSTRPLVVRWVYYVTFILAILYLGVYEETQQFIYFQF